MYSDRFVEELLKNIQALADENRDMSIRIKEMEAEIKRMRFEPLIQITQKMPPCPIDDEAKQKKWFDYARYLLDSLYGLPNTASTRLGGTVEKNRKGNKPPSG